MRFSSNGVLYVGVASSEEAAAAFGLPCCTFRGSVVALDAKTGQKLWQTFMVPDNGGVTGGYSGAGVWGTTPAYDAQSKTLYATTGNNYSVPQPAKDCQEAGHTANQCLDPNDLIDAIVALNADTGQIKWAHRLQEYDDWNVACIFGYTPNCPTDPGPDYDFGSGPNLFTAGGRLVVGAGQKSGIYFALDAKTGQPIWVNDAGPGSSLGGIEWGPATDGKRIYIAEENFYGIPDPYPTRPDDRVVGCSRPGHGNTLWKVYDDTHNTFTGGGNALGPVTVANGVLFAPSMSGKVRALDAATGSTLWSYQMSGATVGGAAVVNGVVYWGNGYSHLGIPGWDGSTKLYAFSINGK